MNKLTKAAIAGGVGIALLLGGAGTLATWNTSTNISGGTIVAGSLTIGTPATTFWTVKHTTAGAVVTTPLTLTGLAFTRTSDSAVFTASPGDKLIYTSTVPLTVTGTNLAAALSLTSGAISATNASNTADTALASALLNSVVFTASTASTGSALINTAPAPTIPQLYTYNLVTGTQNVAFTATMTFPNTPVSSTGVYFDNATQGGSVNFAGMAVTLTQTN